MLAPLRVEQHAHQGLRINCPADYGAGNPNCAHDERGVFVLDPGQVASMRRGYYGQNVTQTSASALYRGALGEVEVVLLPLVAGASLAGSRIAE